ncbi:DUF5329 family protein [Colwellia sp. PAMC 21821]|uniref:DUF5329 family protein n=1 Tax=Colwellia sp. PAMC 21821 TaxID=1816219 RepID=UPI001E4D87E9|nr:DUF5329 family protein [Colwellia sp. PAMC 21821]
MAVFTLFNILANVCPAYVSVSTTGDRHLNLSKVFIILLSAFSLNVIASTQEEIKHLLSFVASTECKYERNGTMHNGKEAVEHINKKYAYYAEDIESTEDFIKYSATKSKMSGKYYKIHCSSNAPLKSQDWLLNELRVYRQAQK